MKNRDMLRSISFLHGLTTGELIKINIITESVSFGGGEAIIRPAMRSIS